MDVEKLKVLGELKDKGILTEAEFINEKQKLINSITTDKLSKDENRENNLIIVGYVMSILPILILPIVFTIVGSIVGAINISKGKIGHGSAQIGISVFCGIVGTSIGGAGFGL